MRFSCTQCPCCLRAKAGLTPWISRQFIVGLHRKTIRTHTNGQFGVHSSAHAYDGGLPGGENPHRRPSCTQSDHIFYQSGCRSVSKSNAAVLMIHFALSFFSTSEPLQSSKASVEGEVHYEPVLWQPRHSGGGALFQGGPKDRGVFGNVSRHSDVPMCAHAFACTCFHWYKYFLQRWDPHSSKPQRQKKNSDKAECNNQANQN